jgi:signal transduction histidine kinase
LAPLIPSVQVERARDSALRRDLEGLMERDEIKPEEPTTPSLPGADPRGELRAIAHDINGALNTIALNLELLERAAGAGDSTPEGARERYMGNLRRAVATIGQIVSARLLPHDRSGG